MLEARAAKVGRREYTSKGMMLEGRAAGWESMYVPLRG